MPKPRRDEPQGAAVSPHWAAFWEIVHQEACRLEARRLDAGETLPNSGDRQ